MSLGDLFRVVLVAVCLAFATTSTVLWIRSFTVNDAFVARREGQPTIWSLNTARGQFAFGRNVAEGPQTEPFRGAARHVVAPVSRVVTLWKPPADAKIYWQIFGSAACRFVIAGSQGSGRRTVISSVLVPAWWLTCAFLLPPMWITRGWYRRLRRVRRISRGECGTCGYDLRGNPDAQCCPECGGKLNPSVSGQAVGHVNR
jgi:hypothetical protein